MLPSSVRRVATTAPQSPAFATFLSGPRAAVTLSGRPNCHQRRCSSSKPPSPDNGSKDISARQSVPASSAKSTPTEPTSSAEAAPAEAKTSKTKATGERRKRKAKDPSPAKQIPVVPSTQYLSKEALGLSTFFSLHRPISVTQNLPKAVTEDAFAAIFAASTRGAKVTDVLSTLSQTVDQLEQPMSNMSIGGHRQDFDATEGATRIDLKRPDGSESAIYVQLNAMSGQFLPFRPPPAPQPASSTAAANQASQSAIESLDAEGAPSHRVYKAILTIEETTDADGQVKVVAHSPQLIEEGDGPASAPRTFLERMAMRQLRHEEANRHRRLENGMLAISVRRQKKLKMKKKKYKKLMRRTRVLRRKLDRN